MRLVCIAVTATALSGCYIGKSGDGNRPDDVGIVVGTDAPPDRGTTGTTVTTVTTGDDDDDDTPGATDSAPDTGDPDTGDSGTGNSDTADTGL